MGRYDEAVELYQKAIEIDPNDAGSWNNKGLALCRLGRHKEAIESFNMANFNT